tara:strand:- start:60 stop:515 length:456 start_codon:yes stop_codon:yes gene_type:complete
MALITAGKTNIFPATAFHAHNTSDVGLSNPTTLVPVVFNTIIQQTGSSYNTSTSQFTCPVEGWYHFTCSYEINNVAAGVWYYFGIALNGAILHPHDAEFNSNPGGTYHKMHDDIIKYFGVGDIVTVGAANLAGGTLLANTNQFCGILLKSG